MRQKFLPIAFILFFLCAHFTFSQVEEAKIQVLKLKIEDLQGVEKLRALDELSDLIRHHVTYDYERIANETIDLAIAMDSINIAAKQTKHLIHFLYNRVERSEDAYKIYNDFSDKMIRVTDSVILTELYQKAGSCFAHLGKMEESLELYEKAKTMALAIKDSGRYGRAMTFRAYTMSEMGQFVNASQEYQKALKVIDIKKDTTDFLTAKIGLSILYSKNEFYVESLEEIGLVEQMSRESKRYPEYIMSQVMTGVNHFSTENYSKAIAPLKEAVDVSEQYPLFAASITETYMFLANSYSKLDSLAAAKKVIKKIEAIRSSNKDKRIEMHLLNAQMHLFFAEGAYNLADRYGQQLLQLQESLSNYEKTVSTLEVLHKANRALGNQNKELYYFKERTRIHDSIKNIRKLNAFAYYQTLYETEKRNIQIEKQNAEINLLDVKNREQFQRMLLMSVILLCFGIYFYLINIRNKERAQFEKNKKELAHEKIKAAHFENELLNKKIEFKEKDLTNFAVEITKNKEWAEILLDKFERITNTSGQYNMEEIERLGNEIRSKLNIDLESNNFYTKIEQLNSDFYNKLKEKAPKLTKTELRLCSLIRMKMTPKQIANLQNISHTSVITSRYRLRKKILLGSNQDIDVFIQNL